MTTPPPPPEYTPPSNGDGLARPMNDDDRTMGMIAHGGSVIAGFWAPLLIMLIKKDSLFAQQESKEALNFSILIFILAIPTCGIALLVGWVFYIMATIKVSSGEPYRYPFNWRILK